MNIVLLFRKMVQCRLVRLVRFVFVSRLLCRCFVLRCLVLFGGLFCTCCYLFRAVLMADVVNSVDLPDDDVHRIVYFLREGLIPAIV